MSCFWSFYKVLGYWTEPGVQVFIFSLQFHCLWLTVKIKIQPSYSSKEVIEKNPHILNSDGNKYQMNYRKTDIFAISELFFQVHTPLFKDLIQVLRKNCNSFLQICLVPLMLKYSWMSKCAFAFLSFYYFLSNVGNCYLHFYTDIGNRNKRC
jgi:hypothetical protein